LDEEQLWSVRAAAHEIELMFALLSAAWQSSSEVARFVMVLLPAAQRIMLPSGLDVRLR
jgi:hypothetical protein